MGKTNKGLREWLGQWVSEGAPQFGATNILASPFTTVLGPGANPISGSAPAGQGAPSMADLQACIVNLPNKATKAGLLKDLNTLSKVQFDLDAQGNIVPTNRSPADNNPRSQDYSDELIRLNKLPQTISVDRLSTFLSPPPSGSAAMLPDMRSLDQARGGEVTLPGLKNKDDTRVFVSGSDITVDGLNGTRFKMTPAERLFHAIMLHVGPRYGSKRPLNMTEQELSTKSVTPYENTLRLPLKLPPRADDGTDGYFGELTPPGGGPRIDRR